MVASVLTDCTVVGCTTYSVEEDGIARPEHRTSVYSYHRIDGGNNGNVEAGLEILECNAW